MRHADAKTIHLKDYQAPEFGIETTVLHFDLFEEFAVVESTLDMNRSPNAQELILHGKNLVLEELRLNDTKLFEDQYTLTDEHLSIPGLDAILGITRKPLRSSVVPVLNRRITLRLKGCTNPAECSVPNARRKDSGGSPFTLTDQMS